MPGILNLKSTPALGIFSSLRTLFSSTLIDVNDNPIEHSKESVRKIYKDKFEPKVKNFKYEFSKDSKLQEAVRNTKTIFEKYKNVLNGDPLGDDPDNGPEGDPTKMTDRTNAKRYRVKVTESEEKVLTESVGQLSAWRNRFFSSQVDFWHELQRYRSDESGSQYDHTQYQPLYLRVLAEHENRNPSSYSGQFSDLDNRDYEYKQLGRTVTEADRMAKILLGRNPG